MDKKIDSEFYFFNLSINDDRLGDSAAAILTAPSGCFIPGRGWRRSWDILAGWPEHAASIVTRSLGAFKTEIV